MLNAFKKKFEKWTSIRQVTENNFILVQELIKNVNSNKILSGKILSDLNKTKTIKSLHEVEFKIFSQWGDDGIIQFLVNNIDIPNKTFIEFGVENYTESNTRFLLANNNWSGYVIDGSEENILYVKYDSISWSNELYAKCAFITAENINELLLYPKFNPEIGILSVDIDGNDFWVWKTIDVINPVIVIVEYNSVFGRNNAWTVPYDPGFIRGNVHSGKLYYGCSLKGLEILAKNKGYSLIGCNSNGNNAYFVRDDKLGNFEPKTSEECFVLSKFREAFKNENWVTGAERIKLLDGMEVFDIEKDRLFNIDSAAVNY